MADVIKVDAFKKQVKDIMSIVRWNIIGEGKVILDNQMQELQDSIKKYGILNRQKNIA